MIKVRIIELKTMSYINCGVPVLPKKGDTLNAYFDGELRLCKVMNLVFDFNELNEFNRATIQVLNQGS